VSRQSEGPAKLGVPRGRAGLAPGRAGRVLRGRLFLRRMVAETRAEVVSLGESSRLGAGA
jgi:hypothetical protein